MLLDRRQYLVKEHVSAFKLTDTYDVFDPQTGQKIGLAREEPPGWAKWGRLLVKKTFLPTTVRVYETEGTPAVLELNKKPGILRPIVTVTDRMGAEIGRFRSKAFSLGGGFFVLDATGQEVAEVKGDWKGWNFRYLDRNGREIGVITKKWAGLGKEFFTSADNYMIALSDGATGTAPNQAALLLAAGLAIDIVFKEQS